MPRSPHGCWLAAIGSFGDGMTMRRKLLWLAIGVGLLTLVLYWPARHLQLTYWDDVGYLQIAQTNRLTWAGVKYAFTSTYIYYQPLTWLSHGVDCVVWGQNYGRHHLQSVGWHALNAALVVFLVWQLTGAWSDRERLLLAGWVGLVFAAHPLQVEAVAWLAGRKTLLAGFFSLLCLMAYLKTAAGRHWWWLVVAAYTAAVLSKPMAVPLPAVMLALDYFPLRRQESQSWGRLIGEKWLLFTLAAAVTVVTFVGQAATGALRTIPLTMSERLLVVARSFVFYTWKTVWPAWLSPFYPLDGEIALHNPEFQFSVAACLIAAGLAFLARRRWPVGLAVGLAYVALVLPVSGLFQAGGQAVADRFGYLPLLPVVVLVGAVAVVLRRRWPVVVGLALVLHVGWLLVRTCEQIPVWTDNVTMWQAVVQQFPDARVEYRYIAEGLVGQHRYDEALQYAAIAYGRPDDAPDARQKLGLTFQLIAVELVKSNRFAECLPAARRAAELLPDNVAAHAADGLAALKTGRFAEAARELEIALQLQTNLPAARFNLACAYARLGRPAEAAESLRQAVAAKPDLAALAAREPALVNLKAGPP